MFTLKIKNSLGELYELTHHHEKYVVIGVEGLTPPPISVNTSTGGVLDGSFFNSARAQQRNIVITVLLQGLIEKNRAELYRIFTLKKPCELYFKNVNRDVKIECYVESIESDLFVAQEQVQISLICPRAYFEDAETILTELSTIYDRFRFPFSITQPIPLAKIAETPMCVIENAGDAETGAIFEVTIKQSLTEFTIHSTTTGESFGVHFVFVAGDIVTIDTIAGEKSVKIKRGEQEENLINWITDGSKWLKLALGTNRFTLTTSLTPTSADVMVYSHSLYGGV